MALKKSKLRFIVLVLISLDGLLVTRAEPQMIFPDQGSQQLQLQLQQQQQQQQQQLNQQQLPRQLPPIPPPAPIGGVPPGLPQFPAFPPPPNIPPNPLQPPQPFPLPPFPTLTPPTLPGGTAIGTFPTGTAGQQTCVCVPNGSCPNPGNPFDGSGLIDIRIVTNPTSVVTPNIVTPTTCANGLTRCCTPGPYQCGIRYPPVGGSPIPGQGQAPYGAYPWQAVLLGPGDVYQGSGVLIDPLNVLTVAHRTFNFSLVPTTLRVRMGEWNAAGDTEPLRVQEFTVSRIFINPTFNPANLRNDVAILRLSVPVPLGQSPAITTGCLPVNSFVGQRCWVSGWGKNDFLVGTYQTIQKQVDVPILPPQQCQAALSATRLGIQFQYDPNSFICAGGEVGRDACTGDGGAPLVCQLANRWFVAGLVAWGIGCGSSNIPGVYVNIQNYYQWIQQTINTP